MRCIMTMVGLEVPEFSLYYGSLWTLLTGINTQLGAYHGKYFMANLPSMSDNLMDLQFTEGGRLLLEKEGNGRPVPWTPDEVKAVCLGLAWVNINGRIPDWFIDDTLLQVRRG